MAKDKDREKENTCGVSEVDGKYYCTDCSSEIPADQDCPQCKRKVNWDEFNIESHRIIP